MPGGHLVLDYVAYVTSSLTRGFTTRHSPSLAVKNEKKKTPTKRRLHLQRPTRIDPEELHNRLRDATWRPTSHFSDGQISSITSCKNLNSTTEPVLFLRFFLDFFREMMLEPRVATVITRRQIVALKPSLMFPQTADKVADHLLSDSFHLIF